MYRLDGGKQMAQIPGDTYTLQLLSHRMALFEVRAINLSMLYMDKS